MRPSLRFLEDGLVEKIIAEARELICKLGVEIHNSAVLAMLSDHGAGVDAGKSRAYLTEAMIDQALKTVPRSFKLYDAVGNQTGHSK